MSKSVRRLIQIVNEAPISGIETYGYDPETKEKTDFEKGTSFGTIDRRLLTSPKGIQKIVRAFSRTPFTFEVFFVNMTDGAIDGDHPRDNERVDDFASLYQAGVRTEYFGIPGKPGVIRIVMISNLSSPEAKIAMTGWILAHKIGHSLQDHRSRSRPKKFEIQIDRVKRAIFRAAHGSDLGTHTHQRHTNYDYGFNFTNRLTMKSARAGRLDNEFEMFAEMVAQYLINGRVTIKGDPAHESAVNDELEELFTLLEGLVLVEV